MLATTTAIKTAAAETSLPTCPGNILFHHNPFPQVLLVTTAGDFDIELWSREAPKACRNFVQLCLEGYYDGTIFHRVVPGFIVQGGDPTGTGTGGESIYGKPFKVRHWACVCGGLAGCGRVYDKLSKSLW